MLTRAFKRNVQRIPLTVLSGQHYYITQLKRAAIRGPEQYEIPKT